MHNLSEKEVDFIDSDLKSRGIVLEDLRDNLLDHICCILECEMQITDDFYQFYESVLPRFFKEELEEIQTETKNLLRFKNFYTMKKLLKISGLTSVVLIILGGLFKSFHLPGAGLLIMLGGFSFSIVYLPLLILIKLKDDEPKADRLVFGFGLLLGIFMSIGLMFKLMHWPYAGILMQYSTLLFTLLYVPVYFITRVRRPELKFNTTVNSVLMIACGGIFYSLFDLSYSHEYEKNMIKDHIYLHDNTEKIFTSNNRLYEVKRENQAANQLRAISEQINLTVESMAKEILDKKSTRQLSQYLMELDKKVGIYNQEVAKLKGADLKGIEHYPLDKLDQVRPELAMNSLARIQQQLAVNENLFLSSLIKSN